LTVSIRGYMATSRLVYIVLGVIIGIIIGAPAISLSTSGGGAKTTTITETITTTTTHHTSSILTVATPRTITETITTTTTHHEITGLCFSKTERCDKLIASLLDGAERSIHVAVYSFTSDLLAEALIRAKQRGVEVRVIVEKERIGERGAKYERLRDAGIDTRADGNPDLMHHKFVVIDGKIVVTGSYNWSAAAEDRNDENIVIIENPAVAERFEEEFERIWERAE